MSIFAKFNSSNLKRLKIEVSKLFIVNGLINGHKDYEKFIILGRSRVGSNLLISYLNSHPYIYAIGEMFGNTVSDKKRQYRWHNASEYLYKYGFRKYNHSIHAVGFKIFYYHPVKDEPKIIWQLLRDMNNLKVIHLKRNNILRTHLSKEIAGKTDTWTITGKEKIPLNKRAVSLSKVECLNAFEETMKWQKDFDELFKTHDKIDIFYENLLTDTQNELNKVQQFLNLPAFNLKTALVKQNPEPLANLITNFAELKEEFDKTEWSRFFND